VVVSSVGLAGCVETFLADFGAGYRWGESLDIMWAGCDVGPYRAVAAQAGGPRTFGIASGLPSAVVGVRGQDGPPHVALVGPGGRRIEAPADGPLKTDDAIAFHVAEEKTTWFVIGKPAVGQWRVEALPDSTAVTGVVHADGLEKPSVKATVRPLGAQREISYAIKPLPGQKVRFAEEGKGAARDLGLARGPKGKLRFTPTDGPGGTRKIIAMVESNGTPRATIPVARYVAPAPKRPAKAKGLKAARRGGRLAITWRPVAGASRYRARVRLSDGRSLLFAQSRTRRRVTVRGLTSKTTARISVEALRSDGLAGPLATTRLAAKTKKKPKRP
jgi:hypothetical protein